MQNKTEKIKTTQLEA